MGHQAGEFMQGTDMFYRHLFENREAALEVLDAEDYPFQLTPQMFVFSSHQGYIFHLLDCDTHLRDPPVHGFAEGESVLTRVADSFSGYLLPLLKDEISSRSH
jgi:hypothetical protein